MDRIIKTHVVARIDHNTHQHVAEIERTLESSQSQAGLPRARGAGRSTHRQQAACCDSKSTHERAYIVHIAGLLVSKILHPHPEHVRITATTLVTPLRVKRVQQKDRERIADQILSPGVRYHGDRACTKQMRSTWLVKMHSRLEEQPGHK